jgi:hypothetical protein
MKSLSNKVYSKGIINSLDLIKLDLLESKYYSNKVNI